MNGVHLLPVLDDYERPRTRGDCANVPRPCPFVGCKHNNFLEVRHDKLIFPHGPLVEADEVPAETSCSLDVADRGEHTLEQVSTIFRLTRERARQIEAKGMKRFRARKAGAALHEQLDRGIEHDFEPEERGFLTEADARKMKIENALPKFRGAPVRHVTEGIGRVVGPVQTRKRALTTSIRRTGEMHEMRALGVTPAISRDEPKAPLEERADTAGAGELVVGIDPAFGEAKTAAVLFRVEKQGDESRIEYLGELTQETKEETMADGLTEKQRAIAKAYNAGESPTAMAARMGVTNSLVTCVIAKLRKRPGIITRPSRLELSRAARAGGESRPKKVSPKPTRAEAPPVDDDPILASLRARREQLVKEHETRLARLDAAIAALEGV